MLRHPDARSSFDDFLPETRFDRVIEEAGPATENPKAVERLVFCTGKLYYELAKERKASKLEEKIAIARVEQVKNRCYVYAFMYSFKKN